VVLRPVDWQIIANGLGAPSSSKRRVIFLWKGFKFQDLLNLQQHRYTKMNTRNFQELYGPIKLNIPLGLLWAISKPFVRHLSNIMLP
jgi:hypothetical protein